MNIICFVHSRMWEIIILMVSLTACLILGLFVYSLLGTMIGRLLGDKPRDMDYIEEFWDTFDSFLNPQ
jgi:threonine/homoserine/homoserine lactone efflux protein